MSPACESDRELTEILPSDHVPTALARIMNASHRHVRLVLAMERLPNVPIVEVLMLRRPIVVVSSSLYSLVLVGDSIFRGCHSRAS